MKLLYFFFIFSVYGFAQWEPIIPSPTINNIGYIKAFSEKDYLISTSKNGSTTGIELFSTLDGGENWQSIYLNNSHYLAPEGTFYLTDKLGWCITNYPERLLWSTTDGGDSWDTKPLPVDPFYSWIYFIDSNKGFIAAEQEILKTDDNGKNWSAIFTDTIRGFRELSILNENFIAAAQGNIRITTNGGITWSSYIDSSLYGGFDGVYFLDSLTGFAMHQNINVNKTTDGGQNWERVITKNLSEYGYSASAFYNNTGVIAFGMSETDGGLLYVTTDRGETWTEKSYQLKVWSITFLNDSTFILAGDKGRIHKSSDYGSSYTYLSGELVENIKGMTFAKTGYGYFLSNYNYIIHTSESGKNFERILYPYENGAKITAIEDSIIFTSGNSPGRIYRSTNKGIAWDTTFLSPVTSAIFNFSFPTNDIGYASCYDGIYKTTNKGLEWFRVSTIGQASGIHFVDSLTGYLGKYNIYKTTNGGITWIDQGYGESGSIHMLDHNIGATGYNGIYYTHNGGTNWEEAFTGENPEGMFSVQVFKHEGNIIAYASFNSSFSHIYYSLDTCKSWQIDVDYFYTDYDDRTSYLFYDGESLYAATRDGYIFKRNNFDNLLTSADRVVENKIPFEFILLQNYPNPFNPTTTFKFSLPETEHVTLKIYDILGNEIAVLVNEEKPPGEYQVQWNAESFASGVYFYQLRSKSFTSTKKLLLMK